MSSVSKKTLESVDRLVQLYLSQKLTAEAIEAAHEAMAWLDKNQILAELGGFYALWKEKKAELKNILAELSGQQGSEDEDDDPATSGPLSQEGMSEHTLYARGEALLDVGEVDKALRDLDEAYEQGLHEYGVALLILECLNKQGKLEEQIQFMNRVFSEVKLFDHEKAKLYFRMGMIYLHQDKKPQARQALLQVKVLDPTFPGLEEKLKPLEEVKGQAKSRYELLLRDGKIDQVDLEKAAKEAKERNIDQDQVLMSRFGVRKEDLGGSLSYFYNVPFVAFDSSIEPPFELFEKKKLDADACKRSQCLPFAVKGKVIEVLMVNPFDLDAIGELKFLYGTSKIVTKVTIQDDLFQFVESFDQKLRPVDLTGELDAEVDMMDSGADLDTDKEFLAAGDSEVVKLANALLLEAWRRNASDIHIEPNPRNRYCLVRFREDGSCSEFRKLKFGLARPLISRFKIMASMDIAERRLPQDGKIKIKLPDRNQMVEYRVAILPTVEGQEHVVLRVLSSGKPLPLERLGLLEKSMVAFRKCINKPHGLVLVVGPTGSGKTTTLHSAVSYINTPNRKIWTAEDPVEITQDGLCQVQINPKIGLTFASAMRSFLRADPDVILIGEMRDEETADIGVEASLTGHLVFSTLHTNSAPETITRLLDMKIDPFNFADSLICVLAQRLMKTLCPKCKEPYKPSKKEMEELGQEFGPHFADRVKDYVTLSQIELYRPKGCSNCVDGYRGRLGIHELMINTTAIKTMIKFRKPTEEIRDEAIKNGMLTLKQDGIIKVLLGLTDMPQVRAVAM